MMLDDYLEAACVALADAATQLAAARRDKSGSNTSSPADEIDHDEDAATNGPLCFPQREQDRSAAAVSVASGRRLYVSMAGARGLADLPRTLGGKISAALGVTAKPYIVMAGTTTWPETPTLSGLLSRPVPSDGVCCLSLQSERTAGSRIRTSAAIVRIASAML